MTYWSDCTIYHRRDILTRYFFRTHEMRWAVPCENVSSGICGQRRPRSVCASAQADQDLHCPLMEHWVLKNITKYSEIPNQTIYPRWLIVICTVCIYREDTFPHVAPQMILSPVKLFWNVIFLNYFSASTYINEKSVTECQFLQWSNREIIKFHENCFRYKTFPLTTIYFIYKILHSTVKVVPLSMPLI